MICTQFCIILIFKLPREHIYRALKQNKKKQKQKLNNNIINMNFLMLVYIFVTWTRSRDLPWLID